MKIGIYLLQSHHTFLYDFVQLMEYEKNELHLFISEKTLHLLKELDVNIEKNTKVHLYTAGKKLIEYNKYVSKFSEQLDFLVVSPLFSRKGLLSQVFLKARCKSAFIEVTFGDVFIDHYGFFHWDKITNFVLRYIYKRELNKTDGLWLSSRPIIQKLSKYLDKKMLFLPFNFYDTSKLIQKTTTNNHQIIITITGGIEEARKDYSDFFDAVEMLINDKAFDIKSIKFISLGTIKSKNNLYGKKINKQSLDINKKLGFELIKVFEDLYIDEATYRKYIAQTDIILNPINLEQYKYGKFNSGMSESIAYAIPGMYPDNYDIVEELKTSSLFYNSAEELYQIIKSKINRDFLNQLNVSSVENAKQFSFENYRKIIYQFISEL